MWVRVPTMSFLKWADLPVARRALTEVPGWHDRLYILADPRDDTIRYLGTTREALATRLARHRQKPTSARMREWFLELEAAGRAPEIRLLSYAPTGGGYPMELEWIAWFRTRGSLLNTDPGGRYRDASGKPKRSMKRIVGMIAYQVAREAKRGGVYARSENTSPRKARDPWAKHRGSDAERLAQISRKQMHG